MEWIGAGVAEAPALPLSTSKDYAMTTAERIAQLREQSASAKVERDECSRDNPRWLECQYTVFQCSDEIRRIEKEGRE